MAFCQADAVDRLEKLGNWSILWKLSFIVVLFSKGFWAFEKWLTLNRDQIYIFQLALEVIYDANSVFLRQIIKRIFFLGLYCFIYNKIKVDF